MNAACASKMNFVALPVPEIIEGTEKNLGSPWIRPLSLFSLILMGLVLVDPVNVPAKFEVRRFTPIPEIIGGTQKIWAVPGYACAPFSP